MSSYFSAPCVFVAVLRGHWGALWRSTAQAGGNRWVKVCGSWVLLEGPIMLHQQLCAYCPGLKSCSHSTCCSENVTILAGPSVGHQKLQQVGKMAAAGVVTAAAGITYGPAPHALMGSCCCYWGEKLWWGNLAPPCGCWNNRKGPCSGVYPLFDPWCFGL